MSAREFSIDELQKLAKLHRQMDSGEITFVILNGNRVAVQSDAMKHFEFVSGQTIDAALFEALLLYNIEQCQKKMDESVLDDQFIS